MHEATPPCMAYMRSWAVEVNPQRLTVKGERVEKALKEFRNEVNPPHCTSGYVDGCCPSVKVIASASDREFIFQHPYVSCEELYAIAEQSQVGTAKMTLFRLDARKSREFSNVEVLNGSWAEKIDAVCGQIKEVLAPGASKVNAELYKLLVYQKGDFFHHHQDAQLSARMFATLLFFLPVAYTGGQFCIYKPGEWDENVIEDRKKDDGCSWVAFYTDVRHEISKVKGGFRVALSYCLTFDGAMSPSDCLPKMGPFASAMITDYFSTTSKKRLAIPLKYEYTQASLAAEFLKGIDAYVFSALEKIALPEVHFVLGFEKTKVIPPPPPTNYDDYDDYDGYECDHEQVFQGVFLVKHEMAKKYFEILGKSEQELSKAEKSTMLTALRKKQESDYLALTEEVKASHDTSDLEWVVERESGNPMTEHWWHAGINFSRGKVPWLGNMTPAEEYYYLRAAIVVQEKM